MKYQISCLIVIIFCITSTLNTACDDKGMTTSALCTANTTCEWKENTTAGTCEDTTKNAAGANCVGSIEGACTGNCLWDTSATPPACAAGTKTSSGGACTADTITTKAACDGKCTWTSEYYCTEKTASPTTNDPAQGSGFGLKNSILIALAFFLF
jgi:hypothetical protein